jgi:hypothetical protein
MPVFFTTPIHFPTRIRLPHWMKSLISMMVLSRAHRKSDAGRAAPMQTLRSESHRMEGETPENATDSRKVLGVKRFLDIAAACAGASSGAEANRSDRAKG